eukprot:7377608-Prymnesium_polylepis.1
MRASRLGVGAAGSPHARSARPPRRAATRSSTAARPRPAAVSTHFAPSASAAATELIGAGHTRHRARRRVPVACHSVAWQRGLGWLRLHPHLSECPNPRTPPQARRRRSAPPAVKAAVSHRRRVRSWEQQTRADQTRVGQTWAGQTRADQTWAGQTWAGQTWAAQMWSAATRRRPRRSRRALRTRVGPLPTATTGGVPPPSRCG